MKRWVAIGVLGLALLGCATGLPGTATRSFYDLCVVEGRDAAYCEAWASAEAYRLRAGQVGMVGVLHFPAGR